MSTPMTPTQKKWWILANIVGWGGFLVSQELSWRRDDEKRAQFEEKMHDDRERQHRKMVELQRRLGCQGDVNAFGLCADPACMDSDASGDTEPRYVRGHITYWDGMFGPHRTVEDTCAGPEDLSEGACKGEPDGGAASAELVTIHCEKGCRDGACIR